MPRRRQVATTVQKRSFHSFPAPLRTPCVIIRSTTNVRNVLFRKVICRSDLFRHSLAHFGTVSYNNMPCAQKQGQRKTSLSPTLSFTQEKTAVFRVFQYSTACKRRTVRTPDHTGRNRLYSKVSLPVSHPSWQRTHQRDGTDDSHNRQRTGRIRPLHTDHRRSVRRECKRQVRTHHSQHRNNLPDHSSGQPPVSLSRLRKIRRTDETDGNHSRHKRWRTGRIRPLHTDHRRSVRRECKRQARKDYSHSKLRKGDQKRRLRQSLKP